MLTRQAPRIPAGRGGGGRVICADVAEITVTAGCNEVLLLKMVTVNWPTLKLRPERVMTAFGPPAGDEKGLAAKVGAPRMRSPSARDNICLRRSAIIPAWI